MSNLENCFETYASYKNATRLFVKWLKDALRLKGPETSEQASLSRLDEWVNLVANLESFSQKKLRQGVRFVREARDLRMRGKLCLLCRICNL